MTWASYCRELEGAKPVGRCFCSFFSCPRGDGSVGTKAAAKWSGDGGWRRRWAAMGMYKVWIGWIRSRDAKLLDSGCGNRVWNCLCGLRFYFGYEVCVCVIVRMQPNQDPAPGTVQYLAAGICS